MLLKFCGKNKGNKKGRIPSEGFSLILLQTKNFSGHQYKCIVFSSETSILLRCKRMCEGNEEKPTYPHVGRLAFLCCFFMGERTSNGCAFVLSERLEDTSENRWGRICNICFHVLWNVMICNLIYKRNSCITFSNHEVMGNVAI